MNINLAKTSMAYREMLGLDRKEAIKQAKKYTRDNGQETFVYFQRHDRELGDRYDWTSYLGLQTSELWVSDKRIVWSSTDGYY